MLVKLRAAAIKTPCYERHFICAFSIFRRQYESGGLSRPP